MCGGRPCHLCTLLIVFQRQGQDERSVVSSSNLGLAYCAASLLEREEASSRSITDRQPALSWALFLIMHAVIAGMLGISELHRRNASPVHIWRASELKAKPEVEARADKDMASPKDKPAWRIILDSDEVMFGPRVAARGRWPIIAHRRSFGCDVRHFGKRGITNTKIRSNPSRAARALRPGMGKHERYLARSVSLGPSLESAP